MYRDTYTYTGVHAYMHVWCSQYTNIKLIKNKKKLMMATKCCIHTYIQIYLQNTNMKLLKKKPMMITKCFIHTYIHTDKPMCIHTYTQINLCVYIHTYR